ncbi:MAG: sortase [Ruminococcus sp.]|nr:sortase [Ruminococcus sp.]
MTNQNNNRNYPESYDSGYRGRRFRDDGNDYAPDNYDVTQEPSVNQQRPQNYQSGQQRYYPDDRRRQQPQGYDNRRRPQPQNSGCPQGYDNRGRQQPYPRNDYGDNYNNGYPRDRRPRSGYYDDRYDDRRRGSGNNPGRKPKKKTSTGIIVVRVIAVILLLAGLGIVGVKLYHYIDDKLSHNKLAALSQDFDQLYAMNNDFFGWLKIDDTVIDYPVMYTPYDPEKYLHMDFDGNYSESGELFMDADCDPNGMHYLIYGHHMFNGTMFGSLPKYEDEDFFNEHRRLRFDTRSEMGEYEIFAVFYSQVYDDSDDVFKYYECANLNDEGTYNYYVQNVKALSVYDTGVTPQYGEKIVTLSTCNYHTDDGRFVVAAKKVQ